MYRVIVMTSRNLQIFVTVAELGKMTEAARALYITQSSVSQAIASIEQEYGVVLFERLSRGLFLTDAGKELLSYARSYFSVKSDMEEFLLGSGTRTQFESEMAGKHLPINVSWTCCNSEAIKNAVADGHGVSVVSERLVRSEAASGRLCVCTISDLRLDRYFDVVYHKDKYISKPIQSFIDACRDFTRYEQQT